MVRRSLRQTEKLATMVTDAMWHEQHHMLATLQEARLSLWLYPTCAFVDQDMLPHTKVDVAAAADLGKAPYLRAFAGNAVSVRRADGAALTYRCEPTRLFGGGSGRVDVCVDVCGCVFVCLRVCVCVRVGL